MAPEKLPLELEEEILIRVPPLSLARFRTVCKRWNTLFNDKIFVNNHLGCVRPQFILATKSKFYSVSVNIDDDPKVEERELTLDIPGLESHVPRDIYYCDGLLLCCWNHGAAVWNPWLSQTGWIEPDSKKPSTEFCGIGYDNRRPEGICIFALEYFNKRFWNFYNFASDAWKDDFEIGSSSTQGEERFIMSFHTRSGVSLNGTLYWVAFDNNMKSAIQSFNFSREKFDYFCYLPCNKSYLDVAPVLAVFRGDRFSILDECTKTKKIEIWVTKNKINIEDGEDVVWINFMTFSISNLPDLVGMGLYPSLSYFIEDKTLVMCSCDKSGQSWIYVLRGNKWNKIQINCVADPWASHCTCFPSLVPVPQVKEKK